MNVIKGSDLVELFGAMGELKSWARFAEIRRVTEIALSSDVTCIEDLRSMLAAWMRLSEPLKSRKDADALGLSADEPVADTAR